MDFLGSSSSAVGCMRGRGEAVNASNSVQKRGVAHAYMQVFVQCKHQYSRTVDMFEHLKPNPPSLIER